jgi:hypothetical protein
MPHLSLTLKALYLLTFGLYLSLTWSELLDSRMLQLQVQIPLGAQLFVPALLVSFSDVKRLCDDGLILHPKESYRSPEWPTPVASYKLKVAFHSKIICRRQEGKKAYTSY